MKDLIEAQLGKDDTARNPDDKYYWIPEIDPSASGTTAGAVGGLNQTPPAAGSPPVPNGQGNFKAWVDYYKKLNIEIPEGKTGINPAGISRSNKINWLGIIN